MISDRSRVPRVNPQSTDTASPTRSYNSSCQILTLAGVLMTRRVATVDDFPRIDIRYLKRRGMLEPGKSGALSWSCRQRPIDTVSYECHRDRLVLLHRFEPQTVRFDTTACNYGGKRQWFLCPGCSRRVAVLCGLGSSFLCRHCHHLPYLSQNLSKIRRLIQRKQRIESRIFEDRGGQRRRKRKGLHTRTFHRELARYFEIEQQLSGMCFTRINRMKAILQSR